MCGKFTQMFSWSEVVDFSRPLDGSDGDASRHDTNDREETFTPMREPHVLRLTEAGKREMVRMRWGWPDRRSKAPMDRPKHMHTRAETIDTLSTFATSFAQRRGILPAKTFNVGQDLGKKVIQHVLMPRDGKPVGIAVIWDLVPNRDGDMILAFVMVTTEANELISTVTDRMPAILPLEHWGAWLGETYTPLPELKALLVPYPGDLDMKLQPKAPPKPHGGPHAASPML